MTAPKGDSPQATRDRAILALMGVHGLRVAEVAGLQVSDVDLSAGLVKVVGKGQKARTIYLTEQTAAGLHGWLRVRVDVALAGVEAVFVVVGNHTNGTPLSTRAIRYLVDGYLETCGLKREGVSCHSLRHSAATWVRAGGAKLDAIAGMLGHASTDTTRIYSKIVDKMAENPARYLEAVLIG